MDGRRGGSRRRPKKLLTTYRWLNIIDAWRKKADGNLPFAPDVDEWTEEHYKIYTMVELALGNREEVTPEEQEDIEMAARIDKMIDDGDPDWLSVVQDYLAEDGLDSFMMDDDLFEEIDAEQRLRGE